MKAILFDLDGVLVNAAPWHEEAFCRAVADITGVVITKEEHARHLNALPTRVKLAKLLEAGRILPEHLERITLHKQGLTQVAIGAYCKPEPQRIECLKWASTQWQLGCVTNSIRTTAHHMLTKAGLLPYLQLLLTNEDAPFPKPDPYLYWMACSRFRLSPADVLAVEDHQVGVDAATAAGCVVWHLTQYSGLTQEALTSWMTAPPS